MLTEILLIILGVVGIISHFINECRRPSKYPPGPPWLPLVGNLPVLKKLAKTLGGQHLALHEFTKEYNSEIIGLKLGKENVVCVHSYEIIKKVWTSEEYEGRPDNFFMRLRCMGTRRGITATDKDIWKEQRAFLVTHLRALGFGKSVMEEMVKKEVSDITQKIENNLADLDIEAELAISVLNILWILTSGKSLKGDQRIDKFIQLMITRSKAFDMSGGILNSHPWLRYLAPETTGYNLIVKINSEIKYVIMESIVEHKNTWTEGRSDDVIYSFLSERKKMEGKPNYYSDDQLVMVCLDIFIAGSTTTSNTIDFAFLAMILYPEVQEKVYRSLVNAFDKNEDISFCDRHRVPYVEAVLLECQRFFPVVPIAGPRRVLKSTELGEYIIPKDTTVLLNLHSVYSDKDYWKDPEKFRPERFLDREGQLTGHDRILTFGLGRRRCLGDALAKPCLFLFFAGILRKFRIEAKDEKEKPTGRATPGITMAPEKYRAKFIPRN